MNENFGESIKLINSG